MPDCVRRKGKRRGRRGKTEGEEVKDTRIKSVVGGKGGGRGCKSTSDALRKHRKSLSNEGLVKVEKERKY